MHYATETFELYNALFKEAHTALVKEAGLFDRAGGFLRNLFTRPSTVRAIREEAGALRGTVGRQEQALSDAAHKMRLLEHDVAAGRQAAQRAEQYGGELQKLRADPGALTAAERKARLGLGAAGLGLAATPIAYGVGRQGNEAERKRTRNIAFGAGAAAGLAAPQLVRGLGSIARGASQTGLFPEAEGYAGPGTEYY